ncbi:unnamed protein product [Closterium sp. Naga37s-1]|nr:unnamed protein product [Closterium sp. Naga37s-1]
MSYYGGSDPSPYDYPLPGVHMLVRAFGGASDIQNQEDGWCSGALSTAVHMVFEPVFNEFEDHGLSSCTSTLDGDNDVDMDDPSRDQLTLSTLTTPPLFTILPTSLPPGSDIQPSASLPPPLPPTLPHQRGNDEDTDDPSRNPYTLLDFASVPPDAGHLSGSTFIAHSQWGFEGRFTLLHLASSLATWRRAHGCFGPARLMLFQGGMLRTPTRLAHALPGWHAQDGMLGGLGDCISAWANNLLKAVLGLGAASPFKPLNGVTPQCLALENAVVLRQRDTFNASDEPCASLLHQFTNHSLPPPLCSPPPYPLLFFPFSPVPSSPHTRTGISVGQQSAQGSAGARGNTALQATERGHTAVVSAWVSNLLKAVLGLGATPPR